MAEKPKISDLTTVPNEYAKFVQDNIGKAVIGVPEGDGVKVMNAPVPTTVELPVGLTHEQSIQMQSAFKAIMEGKTLQPTNAVAAPPPGQRDVIVPDQNTRMWNPMQSFQPTAKLSDMEASVRGVDANPTSVISYARPISNLNPKDGCSPVLVDCFALLTSLVAGRWLLPGAPSVDTMLVRLRAEIETK